MDTLVYDPVQGPRAAGEQRYQFPQRLKGGMNKMAKATKKAAKASKSVGKVAKKK